MIDEEDINFIKVFLIIMKGGTILCRKLVLALVSLTGKSLENILQGHRQDLTTETWVHKHLTKVQFEKLFPRNNQAIDINQWDISLLTFVLLNVFSKSLNSPVKAAVETLRDKRNNIIGHKSNSKITNVDFASIWLHVTLAIRQLCRMLTPDDQLEYISIENMIYSQPFQTATIKELEQIELTDTFTQSVIEHIMPKIEEKIGNEDVLRRLEKLEKEKDIQGKQIALLAKMQVDTGSASSKRQVQEHLLEAYKNIISKDPDVNISKDEVESSLENLVKGMEEQGVTVKKVEKGSILLTILCPTTCLRDIIVYMKSPQINNKLTQIEKAVDKYHACEPKITIHIDLHSLETAIDTLEDELDVGAVHLTLECSGTWGVKNAFKMFENGESTNPLNKLSEVLSHKVGEKVELHTSIDKDKLEDYIEKREKRKGVDERKSMMERQYFESAKHDEEKRQENKDDIRGLKDVRQQAEETQEKECKIGKESEKQYLKEAERKKENEAVVRGSNEELDKSRDKKEKQRKEEKERKQHLERMKHDEVKRIKVLLLADLKVMRNCDERSQLLLGELFYMEKQRKMEEDKSELRERHDFQRSIYEEMWNENKEDLRRLIEAQRMVGEAQGKMRKSLERSQQLLDNTCGSNLSGNELFSQLGENGSVIKSLNIELDKTRDELQLLQEKAKHRQQEPERKEKDERKLRMEKQYFERMKHDAEWRREVRQQEKMLESEKRSQQLLEKHFRMETERREEDEKKPREENQYFERIKHDTERRREMRQSLLEEQKKIMESHERSQQLIEEHFRMATERREEAEKKFREENQYFEIIKYNTEWGREMRQSLLETLEKIMESDERGQQLQEKHLRMEAERLIKIHRRVKEPLGQMQLSDEKSRQLLKEDRAHVTGVAIGGTVDMVGGQVETAIGGTVGITGGLVRATIGTTVGMTGDPVEAATGGTVGITGGPVEAAIGGTVGITGDPVRAVFDRTICHFPMDF